MKIFDAQLTREADSYTIQNEPVTSIDLMERAAERAANKIIELYPSTKSFIIFAGPGNNGGDGLVIARKFAEINLSVQVYVLDFTEHYSDDFSENLSRLKTSDDIKLIFFKDITNFPEITQNDVLIDAIFGSGLSRKLGGFPEDVVKRMNDVNVPIISIDIPSGLFGEMNPHIDQTIIKATHTITFQYPSLSFMFPENERFVGDFHIIDIGIHPDYIDDTETPYYYVTDQDIVLKKRTKFSHKGTYGHALIVAGSQGKAGASVLAVKAAHRAGAGLVTAHVPHQNTDIIHIASPETMVQEDSGKSYISDKIDLSKYNSAGIGPGIGFQSDTVEMLSYLLDHFFQPIIIDADALTILSRNKDMLTKLPKNSILTPHPKEFERLFGSYENDFLRMQAQIEFSKKYSIYIVLKGAHTAITTPEGNVYFNSTGNPGMSTGGSGDVLTGIITSLTAQGYHPQLASVYGTFLHGKAGDLVAKTNGETGLIASDIINFLPFAFKMYEK